MTLIEQEAKLLIEAAASQGVSDIHILPSATNYHVLFRVNGRLTTFMDQNFDWGKRLISYFKFLANMDVGEKRKPQSGSAHIDLSNQRIELRFSTITNVNLLESLVVRVLQQANHHHPQFRTFFPNDIPILQQLVQRKSGLILFSGPVGSGKTTTIYQLLRERIHDEPIQVITMEDPVEIFEEQFLQTEVNEKAGVTYDVLIKSSLRHHPDIMMIGEIRDEETARMTIRGALTGHLMIATIHAKNTVGVIGRLQELQVTPQQLSQTLIGVVSQRLVPRFCPNCGGTCQADCIEFPLNAKRLALLEILTGEALRHVVHNSFHPTSFPTLNDRLRKAWSYGFIDTKTYHQFEVI